MDAHRKPVVIFLVGPTASGKTGVGIEAGLRIGAEIISADSMQVYRGMDVISAKPSVQERAAVRHHLIDILDVHEEYSAALFRQQAMGCIVEIVGRGKIPLVVGGAGMYVQALTKGMFPDKGKDDALRARLYEQAAREGTESLFRQLNAVDPEYAQRIGPANTRRIVRALEVCLVNQLPMSRLQAMAKGIDDDYSVIMLGIERQRQDLYARINARVDHMLARGLIEEVDRLRRQPLSVTVRQALGIKHILGYLEGHDSREDAVLRLKQDTRRFAKRQMTWFRNKENVRWVPVAAQETDGEIADRILACCNHCDRG